MHHRVVEKPCSALDREWGQGGEAERRSGSGEAQCDGSGKGGP